MRIRRHRQKSKGQEPTMTQSAEQEHLQSAVAQVAETIEKAKAILDRFVATTTDIHREPNGTR